MGVGIGLTPKRCIALSKHSIPKSQCCSHLSRAPAASPCSWVRRSWGKAGMGAACECGIRSFMSALLRRRERKRVSLLKDIYKTKLVLQIRPLLVSKELPYDLSRFRACYSVFLQNQLQLKLPPFSAVLVRVLETKNVPMMHMYMEVITWLFC